MAATKTVATEQQQPTTTEQQQQPPITPPATPATEAEAESLEELMAQKKALEERIRAARAADNGNRLEKVIQREMEKPVMWVSTALANAVARRVAAGQPRDEAEAQVLAHYADLMRQELSKKAEAGK